jgi:hypothetical protein
VHNSKWNSNEHRVHPEHCKVNEEQIKWIGRDGKQQVRVEFPTANGILSAIYTVSLFLLNGEGRVVLGNRIGDLKNCQLSNNAERF